MAAVQEADQVTRGELVGIVSFSHDLPRALRPSRVSLQTRRAIRSRLLSLFTTLYVAKTVSSQIILHKAAKIDCREGDNTTRGASAGHRLTRAGMVRISAGRWALEDLGDIALSFASPALSRSGWRRGFRNGLSRLEKRSVVFSRG
jgi:hypothetical protein